MIITLASLAGHRLLNLGHNNYLRYIQLVKYFEGRQACSPRELIIQHCHQRSYLVLASSRRPQVRATS